MEETEPMERMSSLEQRDALLRPPSRLEMLRADRNVHLHGAALELKTLHQTSFFSGREVFRAIREAVVPGLIAANAAERRLRIWCAACSTGQEAYSVAMLLREDFPELEDWDVKIVGTDLSSEAIEYARRGAYQRAEVNLGLPARLLLKYFTPKEDEWEVEPELRSQCAFAQEDLCIAQPATAPLFDLVLLRNVLLQIPQRHIGTIFHNVYRQMAPHGVLMMATSEQAEDWTELFRAQVSNEVWYYRPGAVQ